MLTTALMLRLNAKRAMLLALCLPLLGTLSACGEAFIKETTTVRFVDSNGKPQAGLQITFYEPDFNRNCSPRYDPVQLTTDASGKVRFTWTRQTARFVWDMDPSGLPLSFGFGRPTDQLATDFIVVGASEKTHDDQGNPISKPYLSGSVYLCNTDSGKPVGATPAIKLSDIKKVPLGSFFSRKGYETQVTIVGWDYAPLSYRNIKSQ